MLLFKYNTVRRMLFTVLAAVFVQRAEAQEQIILSLDQAVSRAVSKNSQVRASMFLAKQAEWDKANAWLQLMPSVSFNTRLTWIDDETYALRDFRRYLPEPLKNEIPQTVFQTSYISSFDATMPLFNPALFNNIAMADAGAEMARKNSESARENIIFQVISTYLNVLKSRAVLGLQQEYLELSRKNYDKSMRLKQAGRYSKTEALRWKVDMEQQRSVVVTNESMLRSHTTVLKRLLNLDMEHTVSLKPQVPEQLAAETARIEAMSEQELLGMIRLSKQDLVKANAALAAARANTRTSKYVYRNSYARYLPSVSASYSYGWRENDTPELDDYSPQTFMLTLNIPVFTGFQNLTSVKSSQNAYRASQEQFNDQVQNTRYILTESVNRILNLRTQKALAHTNAEFNRNNYSVVEQQWEKGRVSNIDYIDAKLNLQNAALNAVHTDYDLAAAVAELYYLLGRVQSLYIPVKRASYK